MNDEPKTSASGVPPRLDESAPQWVPVEVEPPGQLSRPGAREAWEAREPRHWGPPVHPLAALLLLGVDNLWNLADWAVVDWFITIPLSFMTVFFPTLLIQRLLRRDRWGRALFLALLLGVIAGIPTSVFGSPVGVALLAWFGIDQLVGRPRSAPPKNIVPS